MRCLFHSNNRFNRRKLHTSRLSTDELGSISSSRTWLVSFYVQQQWGSIKTPLQSRERWGKEHCLRTAAHRTSERGRMNHLSQNQLPCAMVRRGLLTGNSSRHFKTKTTGFLLTSRFTYRLVRRYHIWLDYSSAIFFSAQILSRRWKSDDLIRTGRFDHVYLCFPISIRMDIQLKNERERAAYV